MDSNDQSGRPKSISTKSIRDILLAPKPDRRKLPSVPDSERKRAKGDRRGENISSSNTAGSAEAFIDKSKAGIRYKVSYSVRVSCRLKDGKRRVFYSRGVDISATGILLRLSTKTDGEYYLSNARSISLKFEIEPGSMPEGYEMKIKTKASFVRFFQGDDGDYYCGLQFLEPLSEYTRRKKDKHLLAVSSLLILFITGFIMLMRAESIIYFKFHKLLYFYSIMAAVFLLTRYLFGFLYRPQKIDMNFTPGVTIIIPCFNEEEWIHRTITDCINQDYPMEKLEVIVVDDCSSDRSVEKIKETIERLSKDGARFDVAGRLKYFVQPENKGKRDALARGVLESSHELVVFVDSDSFLDPFAIRNLVVPFKDPKMGGVSGRTEVANTYTNVLTKMQSVRYYIAFRIMKAAEAYFDAVTCLSGPLSCYRKDIVLEHMDEWINQKFLGRRATFGDDRSMTNFVLRRHRTGYQDTAVCSTVVPNSYKTFLAQQMRWKRSWLRESIIAGGFMWRKEPFMAVMFYIGLIVPVAAPVVVLYNLIYTPIIHRVLPITFLTGLLMMALMMSFVQLFLRKSSTWAFGMLFCFYYEAVLLWQMPVAWFTFWKSTWGTRMTPEDVAAGERRRRRRIQRSERSRRLPGKKGGLQNEH
ncbi:MAG: glycosyltransferase family 2 protein [Christensenellales bacterium]|jgi:hyaluronan synthase